MLPTIEATINQFGQIAWSEPVQIEKSQKILITFFSFPNSVWECLPRRSASNSRVGRANLFLCASAFNYLNQEQDDRIGRIGSLVLFCKF